MVGNWEVGSSDFSLLLRLPQMNYTLISTFALPWGSFLELRIFSDTGQSVLKLGQSQTNCTPLPWVKVRIKNWAPLKSRHQGLWFLLPQPAVSVTSAPFVDFQKPVCARKKVTYCVHGQSWGGWVSESPFWIISLWRHLQGVGNSFQKKCSLCHANQRPGMEMRFLITWAFSEPPAGAGGWLSCFHVEVLGSGLAWARAWAAASKSLFGCIQLGLQETDAGKVISELCSSALSLLRKTWVELALHFVSQCSELLVYVGLLSTELGEQIGHWAPGSEGLTRSTCSCFFLTDSILLHIQTDPDSDFSSLCLRLGSQEMLRCRLGCKMFIWNQYLWSWDSRIGQKKKSTRDEGST